MDKNGKITALKGGTAVITLKGGSKILEVQVKVTGKKRPPKKDSEDPSEKEVIKETAHKSCKTRVLHAGRLR